MIIDGALDDQAGNGFERMDDLFTFADESHPWEQPNTCLEGLVCTDGECICPANTSSDFYANVNPIQSRRRPAQLVQTGARTPTIVTFEPLGTAFEVLEPPTTTFETETFPNLSQYFDFGGNSASGRVPLQSTVPGWTIEAHVGGELIERTFGAINRQTWVSNLAVNGATRLDPETVLAIGLKLGAASSAQNAPAATVNSAQAGVDLGIRRLLAPNLLGGLYFGYDLGVHDTLISSVDSSFLSHNFTLGGTLGGELEYDAFTLTPSATAIVQYRHRPSFTDGAGVDIAASNTITLGGSAGVGISRDFLVPESDLLVTPYARMNLLLDYTSTAPALSGPVIPGDPLKGQLLAGVKFARRDGALLSFESQISRGANTMSFGVSGGLAVPIQ